MMLEKIEIILRDQCGLNKSSTVVVGVSGGPDSLCLMHALCRAGYTVLVAHFNHLLRSESDKEARDAQHAAQELSLPCVVESSDVRQLADSEGLSIEEAGRNLRYAFLFAQARKYRAQAVAVGHTADDQVETLLMHFIRGAGLRGLRGMSYRTLLPAFDPTLPVVRPLLEVRRSETVAYCVSHDLRPNYDATNESLDHLRNRVRHELIPALEVYNPRIRETILRNARSAASDYDLLSEMLAPVWQQTLLRGGAEYIALDAPRLRELSGGMQKHLIGLAAGQLAPTQEIASANLDRAASFISAQSPKPKDLAGGLRLLREEDVLYIYRNGARLPSEAWPQMPAQVDVIPVSVPGVSTLAGRWQLTSRRTSLPALASRELGQDDACFCVCLDAQRLPERLELRLRHPGDRFRPLGLGGHSQKLSDVFINQKLPARARARWPLLCAGSNVLWVPGYRPAEEFKVQEDTREAACFWLRPSTDSEISRQDAVQHPDP